MSAASIQASGSFDPLKDEYSLTVTSGGLAVTFDFLKKEDIRHLLSCLYCMLDGDEPVDQ